MKKQTENENTPTKEELLFIHKLLNDPTFEDKFDIQNLIHSSYNSKLIDYYLQGGFMELEFPEEVIRVSDNEWLLKKELEYQYILTIEKVAGRMKITMKENVEPNFIHNVYSCSWTFNEIVAKNSFLGKFEDIDNVIEILKNMLGNQVEAPSTVVPPKKKEPAKFSFKANFPKSDNQNPNSISYKNSFITLTFNVFNTNTQLELVLLYLEKDPKEEEEEMHKQEEFEKQQCIDLQDEMFELSLKMSDLLEKNQLEAEQIFPDEINNECIKRWKRKNPQGVLPKFKPYVNKDI